MCSARVAPMTGALQSLPGFARRRCSRALQSGRGLAWQANAAIRNPGWRRRTMVARCAASRSICWSRMWRAPSPSPARCWRQRVIYADPDFAVLRHGAGPEWMLHADHTYGSHPLLGLTGDGALRGPGRRAAPARSRSRPGGGDGGKAGLHGSGRSRGQAPWLARILCRRSRRLCLGSGSAARRE